jgi:hypothetical protein
MSGTELHASVPHLLAPSRPLGRSDECPAFPAVHCMRLHMCLGRNVGD